MAGSVIDPTATTPPDGTQQAGWLISGTGTFNDGRTAPAVVVLDPATGKPAAASGGGGAAVTIANGADVTQGTSTDTSASLTIMGRLLKFIALFPESLGQKLMAASMAVTIASDQSPLKANIQGGATLNHNQVSVATTVGGTLIVAANAARYALIIKNFGPGDVFLGNTGLVISSGHKLSSGESFTTESTAAFYGIVPTTATTVSFLETAV